MDVVSIYDNPKMLLNSASGIESEHQVSSQDRYIVTTNIESSRKKRTIIKQISTNKNKGNRQDVNRKCSNGTGQKMRWKYKERQHILNGKVSAIS